jgi:uncharacterized protein YqgV (UPF0045/DUF77 family)
VALVVEFTVEPFVDGEPGPHVRAALAAARDAADRDGLSVEFGPFGTAVAGEDTAVLDAVDAVVRSAVAAGATRVSLQLARTGANAVSRLDDDPAAT